MNATVIQNLPLALLAYAWGSSALAGVSLPGTSSVASLEWTTREELPTQTFSEFIKHPSHVMAQAGEMLSFMTIAKSAMPEGRSLKDWEKEDIDEFIWSQFQ